MENITTTQWLATSSTSAYAGTSEGGHAFLGDVAAFAGDVRLRAAASKPSGFAIPAIPAIRVAAGMAAQPRTPAWSPPV